jgi:GNAT superfamily N-acetyltransferase
VTDYQFHPATQDRWPHLEELFGERGACGGCWCMAWRKTSAEFQRDKGAGNRKSLRALLKTSPPPGILAYSDGKAVGWCAVAPRPQYVFLEKSRVLRPLDEAPVWSVSCFFVEKKFRRKGLSVELLMAATQFVKEQGGSILEGYPVLSSKGKMPDIFVWTGLLSAFLKAGFEEMPRWSENRPIVRYVIR